MAGATRPPAPPGRRGLSTGLCIFLLATGAIFWFAFPGKVLEIHLHVIGFIVVCAGLLGLVLRRQPGRPARDLLSRWAIPRGALEHWENLKGDELYIEVDDAPVIGTFSTERMTSTLADDLLGASHDPVTPRG